MILGMAGQFAGIIAAYHQYIMMDAGSAAFIWVPTAIGLLLTVLALAIWCRRITTMRGRLKLAGKLLLFYGLTCGIAAAGFLTWQRHLWQQYVSLRDSQPKTLFFRFPPSAEFRALLTESKNFQIRDTVSAIPVPVRASFAKNARQESFAMAEPGADWNVTDVMVKPGLPFYRLGKVALSKSLCILFYEEGGFGWSYRVDVFQVAPDAANLVWRAYSFQTIDGPTDLLTTIDSGKLVSEN